MNDVLDILAHVAGLGQRGGIGDHERHVEQPGQCLGQQCLAGAGGANQQDVAFGELDFILRAGHVPKPLVVVVNRHRQRPFGHILTNHVLIQAGLDLARDRQIGLGGLGVDGIARHLVANDVVAQLDAFVADEHRRPSD